MIYYFVSYSQHQFINGKLILLGNMKYEVRNDTIKKKIFTVNQNNEIIYLDAIDEECTISNSKKTYRMNLYKKYPILLDDLKFCR